jgi:predicted transcriptional regulator
VSDTVLEQPLVRRYLRELDKASLMLPAAQARELRQQVAAHFEEALPPGASGEQVRDVIGRLGTPRSLAAAAAGPVPRPLAARLRGRLARVRWRLWVRIGALIVVAGPPLTYALLALNAAPLTQGLQAGWYFPQDQVASVTAPAGDENEYSVPARFGQEQGIEVSIVNDSDWTQTVLGGAPYWTPFTSKPVQVAVSSEERGAPGPVRWSSSGSIPPHSVRLLRVLWNSNICVPPNEGEIFQDLVLTVRVGVFTRTEDVSLASSFDLDSDQQPACR